MRIRSFFLTAVLAVLQDVHGQQCQNNATGLVPITDMGESWFSGLSGGLYGNGLNGMPQSHLDDGIAIASQVIPLDAQGNASPVGRIGFISMGMSNGNMFFAGLRDSALAFPYLNSSLTLVNGATGGYDIDAMLDNTSQYWTILDQKLSFAGITNSQVQVIWFMQAKHISGIPPNEGIEHIDITESKFLQAFQYFRLRFPNLRQIFCSGRDYGGYNVPGSGNPEPYAYYTNWAFRKLVERQMSGDPELSYSGPDPKTAWLAWANYVWADGETFRSDGFNWRCPEDVQADGVHPSEAGKGKVASLLFQFFKSDTTSYWFRDQPISSLMAERDDVEDIILYPNPANGEVRVVANGSWLEKLELTDLRGRKLMEASGPAIDVSTFPRGIYLLRVCLSDRIRVIKLVLE